MAPLMAFPMILFGGFFVNLTTVPVWLRWLQWVSPIRYGMEAMAHLEMDNAHYPGINDFP